MKRLTIRGHVSTFTGYGQMLCEVFSGLERRGVYCSVRASGCDEPFGSSVPLEIKSRFVQNVQPEDWELLIRSPWELPTPGKKTIFWTMWESTRLPDEYVGLLNHAHRVIVPNKLNAESFAACGVKVPISVVPLGYSDEIFSYVSPKEREKLVIGIAGRVAHGHARKGIRRAIDLFLKAFPNNENVELQVKVHPDCAIGDISDPRIVVTRDHLKWHQVRQWFSDIDVFLSLATFEGFGLWQLQSMAMGRPVMAMSYAGLAEFLTKENSFRLPFDQVPNPDYGGGLWANCIDEIPIYAMRYLLEHRDEIKSKGLLAGQTALDFTWKKSVGKLYDVLEQDGVWA